jgi:hypothetical protein
MASLMGKRGEALTIIVVVVIIVIFLGWLVNFNSRECRSNTDCSNGFYCGSDFACHQVPVVEKTIVKNNLIVPSAIIGVAIIIASLILRSKKTALSGSPNGGSNAEKQQKNPLRMP